MSRDSDTAASTTKRAKPAGGGGAGGDGFFFLGASHHTTSLAIREKLALTENKLPAFQARLAAIDGLSETVVLSTCNRVEIYGFASDGVPGIIARIESEFCAAQEISPGVFRAVFQQAAGRDAIQHLLEVASGLDSQMLGETEILGQVKDAYACAHARRATGPVLNRVFQKTFQYAKHVRGRTAITVGQTSIASVAVGLARKILGRHGKPGQMSVLLLGAGDISEKTARALHGHGGGTLTVASRTFERAEVLARAFGARALPFERVPAHLADCDIVVCSAAAPGVVIHRDAVVAAMRARGTRPLFFIDLAVPRNVDPGVAGIENVFLHNLDDLARIAGRNRAARQSGVAHAREIVREKSALIWKLLP